MPARIAPAPPPYPAAIQSTLDQLRTPGEQPLSLFRTLARDERLFARFTGGGLLDPGHLSLAEREIVIHRICALNGAGYEWGVHAALFAEAAGLDAAPCGHHRPEGRPLLDAARGAADRLLRHGQRPGRHRRRPVDATGRRLHRRGADRADDAGRLLSDGQPAGERPAA